MNTQSRDRFEDRLLVELDQVVAQQPAPETTPARRRMTWKPRVALGAAAVGLAAAAVLVPSVVSQDTKPAYAITETERDGKKVLEITFNDLRNPEALEKDLAERGINADVTYLDDGKMCKQPRFEHARSALIITDDPKTLAIDADDRGQTLVLELSESALEGGSMEANLLTFGGAYAKGEVEPCVPVSK